MLAFTVGQAQPPIGMPLLVAYPLWDRLANYADARHNGGLRANPSQAINIVVSAAATVGILLTVGRSFHTALGVIGGWAALSGFLQLSTGVRRWREASALGRRS